jgi:hypothetical protein
MPRTTIRRPTQRSYRSVLALVVVPSVVVALVMSTLYFVVLPLVPAIHQYYFPESTATYATYRIAILGHIAAGSVALVLGPLNLWNGLRRKHRRMHRRIGGAYAVAVSLAATFAIFMAFHAYAGTMPHGRLVVTSGFVTLGIVWLGTLGMAVHAAAVRHDVQRHAFWIIVNVSATYSAVVFRLFNGVIVAMDRFEQLYPLLGWVGWLPSVAAGVWLARRYAARTAGRGTSRPTVAPVPAAGEPVR